MTPRVTVWASFLISNFLRLVLEEDVKGHWAAGQALTSKEDAAAVTRR